ncbi:MAG: DUF2182 domain-containing protein [Pseudomonadota bacterium]
MTRTELVLRRDRAVVLCGLGVITALAWWWVLIGAGTGMSTIAMTTWAFPPPIRPAMVVSWNLNYAIVMFLMWWVMMIAMMTPSAAPMVLLYARVHRHGYKLGQRESAVAPTLSFAFGYLFAWGVFSVIATGLQWALEHVGLLHAMMMWSLNPFLTAAILISAGVYQVTPLKHACLEHCRSPVAFLSTHFRPGAVGALRLGWIHGLYCLGCCWVLMGLLFAGGIMNLVWIAGLSIFVLVEKLAPAGQWVARISGAGMIGLGSWIILKVIGTGT